MRFLYLYLGLILLGSCGQKPSHPDAERLCRCYHVVMMERDLEKGTVLNDSCLKMYSSILSKLEDNDEELDKFYDAYEQCR